MLSGELWPVHPHPLPDELLSSWLVRTAHANGTKVQSFSNAVFESNHEVWNRDIDRLAPEWIIRIMAEKTATDLSIAHKTTLKRYRGILYDHATTAGIEFWIGSLHMYHRKRLGYGLSFCPLCLAEDIIPYYRTEWRVALQTFCPKHQIMMIDQCPNCHSPITFHRIEIGVDRWDLKKKLSSCSSCSYELSQTLPIKIPILNTSIHNSWSDTLKAINSDSKSNIIIEQLRVLHQFTKILTSKNHSMLLNYLCEQLQLDFDKLKINARYIEAERIDHRHQIISLAWWLLDEWPKKLETCWLEGKIRFNYLIKDFISPPIWYSNTILKFAIHYKKRERIRNELRNDPNK